MLDADLMKLLACPACHAAVRQEGEMLICDQCATRYPIREGVPVMLIEEAHGPDEG